jgi:hypothetical protein
MKWLKAKGEISPIILLPVRWEWEVHLRKKYYFSDESIPFDSYLTNGYIQY